MEKDAGNARNVVLILMRAVETPSFSVRGSPHFSFYLISGKVTKKTCQGKLTLELEKDGITRILNNVRPEHSDILCDMIREGDQLEFLVDLPIYKDATDTYWNFRGTDDLARINNTSFFVK